MTRSLTLALAVSLVCVPAAAQQKQPPTHSEPPPGMAEYALVVLTSKPVSGPQSPADTEGLMAAHLGHIREMAREGKLVLAGPFTDGAAVRGIFIFKTSLDEAKMLVASDPAVKVGHIVPDIHPWWGPKDIGAGYASMCEKTPPEQLPMTEYQFAFLTRGPSWTAAATPEVQKIQEGHMANIRRLAAEGKLVAAGPFLDDGTLAGLFVFKVGSVDEAKALAATDPAVKAGRLSLDIHPWMVADGLMPVPKTQ